MSWKRKIQNDFIIRTGDGTEFRPYWITAQRTRPMNRSAFNFPGKKGTKIDRFEPQGFTYDLEIYFQGDDHLEQAKEFDQAAIDPRPWRVRHPKYGSLLVQPGDLTFDDSNHNVTIISGTIAETISDEGPSSFEDTESAVESDKAAADDIAKEDYAVASNPEPDLSDVKDLKGTVEDAFSQMEDKIKDATQYQEAKNAFEEATRAASNAIQAPGAALDGMQRVINTPARLEQGVRSKLSILQEQFQGMRDRFVGTDSASSKKNFEMSASANISAQALASIKKQPGDYQSRSDVFKVMDDLVANYDQFLTDIDGMQTDSNDVPNAFLPSHDVQAGVNKTFKKALAGLFDIALETSQERFVQLHKEADLITLTHRYYGFSDENLEFFIRTNEVGLEEFFLLPAGRYIVYYV